MQLANNQEQMNKSTKNNILNQTFTQKTAKTKRFCGFYYL